MAVDKLEAALLAVDWKKNVQALLSDTTASAQVASANLKLAVWALQFESADLGNPALSFVREMQIAGQHAAVLVALSLYKPAASCIRAVFETALYYSYFRTHHSELETLARGQGYYIDKRDVLEFHKKHTLEFVELQQKLGLVSELEVWYGQISSIVHGQVPGAWIEHKSVATIAPVKATQDIAVRAFLDAVHLVHRFFLCTTGRQLWDSFSPAAKKQLLSGLSGDHKKALKLSTV